MARLELARYTGKRSDVVSALVVAAHVAFVVAPILLAAALPIGWHIFALWIWFGLAMNGLLNLMHEAAHYHVFHSRTGSNLLGRWVLGPLSLADFDAYRDRHWRHHRRFGQPDDPKTTYHLDIHGWRIIGYAFKCLLVWEALAKFRMQTDPSRPADDDTYDPPLLSKFWLARTAIVQLTLMATLLLVAWVTSIFPAEAMVKAVLAYGFVYAYGLASVTVFAAGVRGIAEHQISGDDAPTVGEAALRNFHCNAVSRLILGAYGFGEHATHHREPAIPYYQLGPATADLAHSEPQLAPHHGYVSTLWTMIKPRAAARQTVSP